MNSKDSAEKGAVYNLRGRETEPSLKKNEKRKRRKVYARREGNAHEKKGEGRMGSRNSLTFLVLKLISEGVSVDPTNVSSGGGRKGKTQVRSVQTLGRIRGAGKVYRRLGVTAKKGPGAIATKVHDEKRAAVNVWRHSKKKEAAKNVISMCQLEEGSNGVGRIRHCCREKMGF